jgi:Tfp pilus assembly protein PilV
MKLYGLKQNNAGQSLLEVIIAMAIFSLIAAAMVTLATGGFVALNQGGEQTEAEALAQEALEAVRAIRDNAWNEIIYTTSSVSISGSEWVFDGEGLTDTVGQYTRTIQFDDVCRDESDSLTDCPGSYTDVHSKKVTVYVSWEVRGGITNEIEQITYVSNWDSSDWVQTDWFGGSGQTTWSDTTMFNSQDGNVVTSTAGQTTIISGDTKDDGFDTAGDSSNSWPFSIAGNYTYDGDKILVTGAVAQLVGTGGTVVTDTTTNPDFDTDLTGWTYADWVQPGGMDVIGSRVISGGNPNGYAEINIPGKKNVTASGYWEQSFVTTEDNPEIATTTLDWKIFDFSPTLLTSFQVYVFVDTASGDPTLGTEVWSSGEISATSDWQSVSDIDISSKITVSSTYYLKVAVRTVRMNGQGSPGTNNVGIDNVSLFWKKTLPASYPSDIPSIYPDTSFSVAGLSSWSSFAEESTKNGGEIHYQLSHDDGNTWQYWNGSAWVTVSGVTDYNTSTVVNANIGTFTVVNSQIKFKAFLESDSTQFVQLDNVNIGYDAATSFWDYSAWDVGGGEVTPTGINQSSGGNDGRYAEITVPKGGGDEIGGYWEQSFTTYRDNPSGLALNYDYKVIDFNGTPNVAEVRTYIDTTSGDPVNLVATTTLSAEGNWTAHATSTPSAQITTAGVYYLKVVLWVETPAGGGAQATGPFVVGFDNVNIDLGNGEYPTTADLTSSDLDTGGTSKIQIIEWDGIDPGAQYAIKFQIRTATDQAGLSGAEWSGPDGKDGDTTDYFTMASGTLIHTDHNNDRWIRYKAFLSGDGDDTPTVQEVRVNYK